MTFEEYVAREWPKMAQKEKHRPALPVMPSPQNPKRGVSVDTLTAHMRANPGQTIREMCAALGVSDGQLRYTLQSIPRRTTGKNEALRYYLDGVDA
jgi:hypothetical protein